MLIESNNLTPMMQQYCSIKSKYQEYLLFYRLGDFYELFFDDAITAAKELDIVLTRRGQKNDEDIPMCGIPFHACDVYLQRLIRRGYSVAICDQMETPEEAKKRGYKAVVRREVIRILTPGTILEETLLNGKESSYLASLYLKNNIAAITWTDISTGEFLITTTEPNMIGSEISRLPVKELLVSDSFYNAPEKSQLNSYEGVTTRRPNAFFEIHRCQEKLERHQSSVSKNLSKVEIISAGVLLEYLEHTQKQYLPNLRSLKKIHSSDFMIIDSATRHNLELTKSIRGSDTNCTLLSVLDLTCTSSGSRLLSAYLASPLTNPEAINQRLNNVEALFQHQEERKRLRFLLGEFPDVERALSRIGAGRGTARDLGIIRHGLLTKQKVAEIGYGKKFSDSIESFIEQLVSFDNLYIELKEALADDLLTVGFSSRIIKEKYAPQLDHWYEIKQNTNIMLNELKNKYRALTGINSLKISRNNIIGYYVEIPNAANNKMTDELFKHRQSLGTSIRYTTKELDELEEKILVCDTRTTELEQKIITDLCNKVKEHCDSIALGCFAIANLDVFASLAEIAALYKYVRPIVDNSDEFHLKAGRHPIVERNNKSFTPNDCYISQKNNLWLLSGPNMAGKSTFLRQNALICIMAQMGSFVPAESARIGVADKLFSRIGASDNISQGESTFMVEMIETANILNNATSRSLIILDEVGRGTSTYDGLAIAWAVVETIHNQIGARTFFATHYHELSQLEGQSANNNSITSSVAKSNNNNRLQRVVCYSLQVKEWHNQILFTHQVVRGSADKSYGINVAALAGMPQTTVQRAYQILDKFIN